MPFNTAHHKTIQPARPLWVCHCPAPNHVRMGPGLCQTCKRFPHLVDTNKQRKP